MSFINMLVREQNICEYVQMTMVIFYHIQSRFPMLQLTNCWMVAMSLHVEVESLQLFDVF